MEDMIIWGAGNSAIHKLEWAAFAQCHVLFFVDNAPDKWGRIINNIPIYSPEVLKKYKCPILLPDAYIDEIEKQLQLMSYQGLRIRYTQFRKEIVCRGDMDIGFSRVHIKDKVSFVFDSYLSVKDWGGIESWSCMVSNQFAKRGIQTLVMCGLNEKFDQFADNCQHFYNKDEICLVKEMAQKIVEYLPCVFVSHASIALCAARIVKNVYPDQIQLILVAHNDRKEVYETFSIWSDKIDKIICISEKIQNEFKRRYSFGKDILIYRPNPIQLPKVSEKGKVYNGVLKIGFAARLIQKQKRTHLLPKIIENCMQKGLGVEFNIAGEGECQKMLKAYVFQKQLGNYVHVLGWVPPTKMEEFWKEQDIYLNVSSDEGMSLAMLEAMACGVVPVVTDVSGVSDVIEDGKNGFIVSVDNWQDITEKIEILNEDRELLYKASIYNIELIKRKFDIVDYIRWMMDTFGDRF